MDDRYAVVDEGDERVLGVYAEAKEASRNRDEAAENDGVDEPVVYRVSFHEREREEEDETADAETEDALVEAVSSIPDADLDTLERDDDGTGSFIMRCDEDEVDDEIVERRLNEAGYERTGVFAIPNRVKQKFGPSDQE